MSLEVGKIIDGKVTGVTNFGAFVDIGEGKRGLVHISEISNDYVKDINDHIKVGDEVTVKVLPSDNGKISLSIKQALPESEQKEKSKPKNKRIKHQSTPLVGAPEEFSWGTGNGYDMSFDDMLNKFKQSSDERMHDIKRNMESKRGSGKRGGGY